VIGRIALVLALALAGSACAESNEEVGQNQTVTVTVTEPSPPLETDESSVEPDEPVVADVASTTRFDGSYFSVEYPAEWSVDTAEESKGSYLDTTIRDSVDATVMLRIDVAPGSYEDPETKAAEVEAYLVDEPGYRRLRYHRTVFLGYDAFRWDFIVEEDGVLLRKSDIFFTTETGDGVAVLVQAPAAHYRRLAPKLETARHSIIIPDAAADPGDSGDSEGDVEFCETHDCIENFEEGNGYVVQCRDGTWSQSGGIRGACSHHGGVADGQNVPSVGGTYDPNNDGSTTNWCGASRDGDGDGLWCEGRD